MKILIAEDDAVSRRLLEVTLLQAGHQVFACSDGGEAWGILERPDSPELAILDWMMPGTDGIEICKKIRAVPEPRLVYILILTARGRREDVIAGLEAGADDYITKPFDREELKARVRVGIRMLELQKSLADRIQENARLDLLAETSRALAHHVRNAITPILGMAELFDENRPRFGTELKSVALKEGTRIAAIIDALLDMSETGDIETVAYAGQAAKRMLDLEELIQRYMKKRMEE
jgi:CheY-like chemotaxis protein